MKWVARHKHKYHSSYINKQRDGLTPFLGEAFTCDSGVMIEMSTRNFRDANSVFCEFRTIEECVREECRVFIREYEKDAPRTIGERAAVAAMRVLTFHSDGDLDVLQNSTLRAIQVLQAFQGLLARMERKDETESDPATTVSEQARN